MGTTIKKDDAREGCQMKIEVETRVKIVARKDGDFLHMYTGDKLGKLGTITEYDSISEAYRVLLDGAEKSYFMVGQLFRGN